MSSREGPCCSGMCQIEWTYVTHMTSYLQGRLLPEELAVIASAKNPPLMAATVLGQVIASTQMPDMFRWAIDEQIVRFLDAAAACERLRKQPIPIAYTRSVTLTVIPLLVLHEHMQMHALNRVPGHSLSFQPDDSASMRPTCSARKPIWLHICV